MERARTGDLEAFDEIVRRFQDMAYGCAYAILGDFHLAEDAAQEAFVEAYRSLSTLEEAGAFPGWFHRIVVRRCGRITRRKSVPAVPIDTVDVAAHGGDPARLAEHSELAGAVAEAIGALPEDERMVTTLFYIDGYSHNDIARFLDVSASQVNNRLHASRQRLKKRMVNMVADSLKSNKPGPEFSKSLFNGISLDKWWINPDAAHYEIENGEIVVCNPEGKGPALQVEVGGRSWIDYRVGVDVRAEETPHGGDWPWNVQWCPNNTRAYLQLFGTERFIAAYWNSAREEHFTHTAVTTIPTPFDTWMRFEVTVGSNGWAEFFLDGKYYFASFFPQGLAGMLGLQVNWLSGTRVRLRNLTITFNKPTPEQLRELETDAMTNWEEFKRGEIEAGREHQFSDPRLWPPGNMESTKQG